MNNEKGVRGIPDHPFSAQILKIESHAGKLSFRADIGPGGGEIGGFI
jgi:hypothetical protein